VLLGEHSAAFWSIIVSRSAESSSLRLLAMWSFKTLATTHPTTHLHKLKYPESSFLNSLYVRRRYMLFRICVSVDLLTLPVCEFSFSHTAVNTYTAWDWSFLWCDTVSVGEYLPSFQNIVQEHFHFMILKVKVLWSFETSHSLALGYTWLPTFQKKLLPWYCGQEHWWPSVTVTSWKTTVWSSSAYHL